MVNMADIYVQHHHGSGEQVLVESTMMRVFELYLWIPLSGPGKFPIFPESKNKKSALELCWSHL